MKVYRRLSLPSGRVVADGALVGEAEPLAQVAEPGDYPVFATVGRTAAQTHPGQNRNAVDVKHSGIGDPLDEFA